MNRTTATTSQEEIFKSRTGNDFNFYYKKYYPKLIYYTQKMCLDEQEAEDITTDSFMTAFERINMYEKDKSQFSTWLFTIARNITLQRIKEKKKTISLDVEVDEEGTTLKEFIQEEESFNHIHEMNDKKYNIMVEHINNLPDPYKTVVNMREVQKLPYKEIADKLDLNLSTFKSQLRNARILLQKSTKEQFDKLEEQYLN